MPNLIAYLVLLIWPLVMVALFRKLPVERALIWSLLAAILILPREAVFDLPLIPALDKNTLPTVVALFLCMAMSKDKIRLLPDSRLASLFIIVYVLSPLATTLTNPEPLFYGPAIIPGLRIYDAVSEIMQHMIRIIPFILGYNILSHAKARRDLLAIYVITGLAYTLPILVELRLSPQINYWVYGYYPALFDQQFRFGGFRPVVFMGHSLLVAFYIMMTVLSAATLFRGSENGSKYLAAFLFLFVILVLSKGVGAIFFAFVFSNVILFLGKRYKSLIILASATLVISYPALRGMDAVPVDTLTSYAGKIQAERAQSLQFRFNNEKRLLDHANQKPVFGWGFWGRNHLYDVETGRRSTTTDGYWTIAIGVLGWVGYICIFGLLTLPLFRLYWVGVSHMNARDAHVVYGLALMLSVNLLDLIPNAAINYMTWLFAGILLACTSKAAQRVDQPEEQAVADAAPELRFARSRHTDGPARASEARQAGQPTFARPRPPARE